MQDITQLLHFITTSTYFQFRNTIYRQREGFATGDPLSAIMCGFFMEDLEQKALVTAPSLWKRYVDDILEKVNSPRTTSIKFTHKEETGQSTHTDQHLLWTSEHKLSVVRTLHEHTTIITDLKDRIQEEKQIQHSGCRTGQ